MFEIISGPHAFFVLMFFKSFLTPCGSMLMSFITGYFALSISGNLSVFFSFVNTDLNCWFKIFALALLSPFINRVMFILLFLKTLILLLFVFTSSAYILFFSSFLIFLALPTEVNHCVNVKYDGTTYRCRCSNSYFTNKNLC